MVNGLWNLEDDTGLGNFCDGEGGTECSLSEGFAGWDGGAV